MARKLALEVLLKYYQNNSYLNITLNEYLKNSTLPRNDKDLATRIVYGVVQNQTYIEYQLQPFIEGKKMKTKIRTILYMAVYQMLFLDKVPMYAIIDESVQLAKSVDQRAGQFVNAICRNLERQGRLEVTVTDEKHKLSIETSHPLWLINMLTKQYDFETTKKFCIHNNGLASRVARVNTLLASKEEILQSDHWQPANISVDAVCYHAGNIADSDEYKSGKVTIQDESSQLVARYLDPQKDSLVLDMCSAPGSKTTHLSAIMENTGKVVAYDIFEHKIELIQRNIERMKVTNVELCIGDSTKLTEVYPANTFDSILLDAPCSGLGVLMRKPEIKYHDSSAMDTIIPLQQKLLENAYYLLKDNGKMVYSTCTINKKENEMMIDSFIKKHPSMKVIKQQSIMPYEYDSDGFYMCHLEKRK